MEKSRPCDLSAVQALIDREGTKEQRVRWLEHIIQCPDCRQQLQEAIDLSRFVDTRLRFFEEPFLLAIEPEQTARTPDADQAWERFQKRIQDEPVGMGRVMRTWTQKADPGSLQQTPPPETGPSIMRPAVSQVPFSDVDVSRLQVTKKRKKWAMAAVSAAAVAVLVVGAQAPWAGKAWAAMLQTFRIEHLVALQPDDMTQIQNAMEQAGVTHLDLKQYGQLDFQGSGTSRGMSLAEAQKIAGYPLKALPGTSPEDQVLVQGGQELVLRPNVTQINELIHRLGGKTSLPPELNGQKIVVQVPAWISQTSHSDQGTITFRQMKSPSIEVPSGVDMGQVRQVLLDLPFLPQDVRQRLMQSENWQNTAFLPTGPGSTVKNTTVNGHEAVLVTETGGQFRTIVWYNNGILYSLDGSEWPTDDSLIQLAEAIDR